MGRPRITWRRFFESHLFFVGGVVALIFLSISMTRAQLKDRAIRAEMEALQNQVETLEGEQNHLTELITLFEKPEFLEKEARRILGYVKPGEKVVVIYEQGKQGEEGRQDEKEMSNPKKWWVYFFGEI